MGKAPIFAAKAWSLFALHPYLSHSDRWVTAGRDTAACEVTFCLQRSLLLVWSQAVLNSTFFWPNSPRTFPCNERGLKMRSRVHSGELWEGAPTRVSKCWWPSTGPSYDTNITGSLPFYFSPKHCTKLLSRGSVIRDVCGSQRSGWYAGKQVRPPEECMSLISGNHRASSSPGAACVLVGGTSRHVCWAGMAG